MKLKKVVLDELDHCYAVTVIELGGKPYVLFATEGHGACYMYSCETGEKSTVWEGPGGTMSIVQIPGKDEVLAIQNFFPTFQSKEACVVWGKYSRGKWSFQKILDLPYLHRFDILNTDAGRFFIGCTLCTSKTEREDWSDPGKIYVSRLPEDLNQPMQLEVLADGLVKNHGYWRGIEKGKTCAYTCSENGILRILPPERKNPEWTVEVISRTPSSDIAVFDVDGDGKDELISIEPFHGGNMVIRKVSKEGCREIYRYPEKFDFGHVVWAGDFGNKATIIGGYRKMDQKLFMIRYQNGEYVTETIDSRIGPSNIAVLHGEDRDVIYSANRQIGAASAYIYDKSGRALHEENA